MIGETKANKSNSQNGKNQGQNITNMGSKNIKKTKDSHLKYIKNQNNTSKASKQIKNPKTRYNQYIIELIPNYRKDYLNDHSTNNHITELIPTNSNLQKPQEQENNLQLYKADIDHLHRIHPPFVKKELLTWLEKDATKKISIFHIKIAEALLPSLNVTEQAQNKESIKLKLFNEINENEKIAITELTKDICTTIAHNYFTIFSEENESAIESIIRMLRKDIVKEIDISKIKQLNKHDKKEAKKQIDIFIRQCIRSTSESLNNDSIYELKYLIEHNKKAPILRSHNKSLAERIFNNLTIHSEALIASLNFALDYSTKGSTLPRYDKEISKLLTRP